MGGASLGRLHEAEVLIAESWGRRDAKRRLENEGSRCRLIAVKAEEQYKGVRGWLLLLCINLTILDPASIVLGVFGALPLADFEKNPEMQRFMVISGVCRLALAAFSLYAGIALWRIHADGPSIAKRYFQAAVLYSAFALLLPGMVGLSDELYAEMAGASLLSSVMTICYVMAWYLYLVKSKRVKATFQPSDQ